MHNITSAFGCRFLFGVLAVMLVGGAFDPDLTPAHADQKKQTPKIPPQAPLPAPNKKPPAKPPRPVQHHNPAAQPAPGTPHPHPDAHPHHPNVDAHPHHPNDGGAHHQHTRALPKPHPDAHKHPPVLAALRHLEQAHAILAEHSNPLYGLARIRALENIVAAYEHINLGIAGSTGRNVPETTALRGLPPGNDFHPIRRALGKVREAQNELKKLTPNLRGQRTAAVVRLNVAVLNLNSSAQQGK